MPPKEHKSRGPGSRQNTPVDNSPSRSSSSPYTPSPPSSSSSTTSSSSQGSPLRSTPSRGTPSRIPPLLAKARDIPLSQIRPPPPRAGNHAALYLTITEFDDFEFTPSRDYTFESMRDSSIVIQPDPNVQHFETFWCLRMPGESIAWQYLHQPGGKGPHVEDYGLLAMKFIAWIPRTALRQMGTILSGIPANQPQITGWSSQKWVQQALTELNRAGILTAQQAEAAYHKQQEAAVLPRRGPLPNKPS